MLKEKIFFAKYNRQANKQKAKPRQVFFSLNEIVKKKIYEYKI